MEYKDIIKELKDKGFKQYPNSSTWYYNYSDFETLEFELYETVVNEKSIVNIDELILYNPMTDTTYLKIDYTLCFKLEEFNKFYELLTLVGYKL